MLFSKRKVLISTLFLSLNLHIATEDMEFQVNNSNFEIFSKEKDLKFLAASVSSSEKDHGTLFFNDISLIISNTDDFDKFVKSDKAQYIRKKNLIHLEKNVSLEIMNEQHPFNLKTENLTLDIKYNTVQANSLVTIQNQDITINAINAKIDEVDKEKRVTLSEATIFSQEGKIGESNKLIFNLFDPIIFLVGSAQISSKDYTMNASEISYNLEKNQIIYSKNSSIITSN
tara:strand:+ start:1967 stop:2653 length:687 start_codon:yes stop_codon:yes gene_type:complete